MSFLNFFGTMGRKTQVETSPARHWVPAWRKASWSDEPPSKRCSSVTSMVDIFPLFLLEKVLLMVSATGFPVMAYI
jgi:hypothetical protein